MGGGGRGVLLGLAALVPSAISFLYPKKGEAQPPRVPPLDPPLIYRYLRLILFPIFVLADTMGQQGQPYFSN